MDNSHLREICQRLTLSLWNVAQVTGQASGLSPRLVFPKKRSGESRFSEQEPRILCCSLLESLNYFYSIETPTTQTFMVSGQTPLSARSDLSLYTFDGDHFNKAANIEFKAHNPTQKDISKDIEKLVRERLPGVWFHLLEGENKRTVPGLFEKFVDGFEACASHINANVSILFWICVRSRRIAYVGHFNYKREENRFQEYVKGFFDDHSRWEQL